jgi:glycosyltransferase involved in cell wall biosynthesis
MNQRVKVQIVTPVQKDAESIEDTILEIESKLSPELLIEFIICKDGSTDGTQDVLARLSRRLPMKLIMSDERKGYSRAVIDGFKAADVLYILSVDSDGQCDPKDFWRFWKL